MAEKVDVGSTCLCKVELYKLPSLAQNKVRKVAEIIDIDVDDLLVRANKILSNLTTIIIENPHELVALHKTTKSMTRDDVARLA